MYATTEAAQTVVDRMQAYGVQATGEVVTAEYHQGVSYDDQMTLGELVRAGGKVTRVRILSEMGYCDLSYVHGTLPSGKVVPLRLDGATGMRRRNLKGELIEWAKRERVFAKGCGLLDEANWAELR